MRTFFHRICSICLLLTVAASFCSCSKTEETGAGYLFTYTFSDNPDCLDPQYTSSENANIVIANIMEGLVRSTDGITITEAGAESYTISEDGLTYMFNLRPDACWYAVGMNTEQAIPVTAKDYVFAFQRMFAPETNSPYASEFSCIKNASSVLAGTMQPDALGVSAPDDTTVLFTLEYPKAEFLQLLAQPCAVPCNEDFFRSTNGRYGLDINTVLCNGPFYLTKWMYDFYGSDNFLSFKKNKTYYDADLVFPSSLQFNIMKTQTAADGDFADGGADAILTASDPTAYLDSDKYVVEQQCADTLGFIFHPDNPTLQNENFRRALAHAIDRNALAASVTGDITVAHGVIPPAVQLLGRSYRELCADEPLAPAYDLDAAASCFEAAAEELQLHSTNTIRILVPSSFTDIEALLAICQGWQDSLGIYIGIDTVTPVEFEKRIENGEYTIALYAVSGSRNSCYSVLRDFQRDAAFYGFQSDAFGAVMRDLNLVSNYADALPLYGTAEQCILDSCTFLPLFYQNSYFIHTESNTDFTFDAFSDVVWFRDAKHFS